MTYPLPESPGDEGEVRTFLGAGKSPLAFRRYGRAAPRAEIVCLHGIQSHGGWYTSSCRRLAAEGYGVSFLDRRGSGINRRSRGDAPNFLTLLDDIAEFLQPLQPGRPGRPVFLLAVSWGGKLAVALQRRWPGLVDGLVLLCPGFCPKVGPTPRERLAIFWSRLFRPTRLFPIPLNEPQLFTASARWQEFLRDDPLSLHQATARLLTESVRLDFYLRRARRWVRVPTLVQLAEEDRIIDNTRTRDFVRRFPGPCEVIEYPRAHHTLEFEPEPRTDLEDLLAWLARQISDICLEQ